MNDTQRSLRTHAMNSFRAVEAAAEHLRQPEQKQRIARAAGEHARPDAVVIATLREVNAILDELAGTWRELGMRYPDELEDRTGPARVEFSRPVAAGQIVDVDGVRIRATIAGIQRADLAQAALTPDEPLPQDNADLVRGHEGDDQ